MINATGLAFGPNDTELLIADIELWKEKCNELYLGAEIINTREIVKSHIEASKLLTRAIELL